jgi:hypothetical protein
MDSASTIVSRALQIAKLTSGMQSQAGQVLNEVLLELAYTYDFSIALNTATVNLTGNTPNQGAGPYNLPANYLRAASRELTYLINGMPQVLTQITLAEFDRLINVSGTADYPNQYATDVSQTPPALFVYPPPQLLIPLQVRYYGSFPEITTPETSSTVPWFPFQTYLIKRVAGELMAIAGDPRADSYLGDSPGGAEHMLRKYLNLQGDREDTASKVQLDARYFGPGGIMFPPSKVTGGV